MWGGYLPVRSLVSGAWWPMSAAESDMEGAADWRMTAGEGCDDLPQGVGPPTAPEEGICGHPVAKADGAMPGAAPPVASRLRERCVAGIVRLAKLGLRESAGALEE